MTKDLIMKMVNFYYNDFKNKWHNEIECAANVLSTLMVSPIALKHLL